MGEIGHAIGEHRICVQRLVIVEEVLCAFLSRPGTGSMSQYETGAQ